MKNPKKAGKKISVTIKYSPQISLITGLREENIYLNNGSTVNDLLRTLSEKYGSQFDAQIFLGNTVKDDTIILLNGRTLKEHKELFGQTLGEEDVLALLSIKSGG
jgi:molybdopterin converting factor small subunit